MLTLIETVCERNVLRYSFIDNRYPHRLVTLGNKKVDSLSFIFTVISRINRVLSRNNYEVLHENINEEENSEEIN